MAAAAGEFVDGWLVAQVLGEGSYGEVRLLVHAVSGVSVALKAAGAEGAREAALHRALKHPHVLRLLGHRAHPATGTHYLFLEYAQGGELFDRIEPDAGMSAPLARRYWRQLLAGLRYLHARGVAHRDVKPENLLLDHHDDIKISDFGMATLFRHEGRERLLSRVCGTLPYAAPEVLGAASRPYRAAPADCWSAALVLLAMLAGELPWERASEEDARFVAWRKWSEAEDGDVTAAAPAPGPWRKLSDGARRLLRRAMRVDASRRAAPERLLQDAWLAERTRTPAPAQSGAARSWASQPARPLRASSLDAVDASSADAPGADAAADALDAADAPQQLRAADMDALLSHSQPAHADDLLLATQENSPMGSGGVVGGAVCALVVRRLSRVWVRCDEATALKALTDALTERRYDYRHLDKRTLAISCSGELRMRAWVWRAGPDGHVVVEFRRSRGCGLDFKRRFVQLRDALSPLAAPLQPPLADLLAPLRPTGPTTARATSHEPMDMDHS